MRNLILGALLVVSPLFCSAQYFSFFQQEYFFGWLPNPRADAMGKSSVAVGENVSNIFQNPAAIGLVDRAEFTFTTGGPFYFLKKSDYFFGGGAWRFHPRLVGSISLNLLAIGPTSFDILINNTNYPTDKPAASNLTLTLAGNPVKNLQVGLNMNYFRWKYIKEVSAAGSIYLDLGAIYTLALDGNQDGPARGLRFGASVVNLSSSGITFKSPMGDEASNNLPVIGRYAVSYFNNRIIKLPGSDEGGLALLFTAEYQDLYNADFRTAFRLGSEVTLYDVFAFRLGFYTQSEDDMGIPTNKSRISTLTYGFGLILPLAKLSNGNTPVNIHFDFTSLNHTPVATNSPEVSNMRSFGLRCVWAPKKSSLKPEL